MRFTAEKNKYFDAFSLFERQCGCQANYSHNKNHRLLFVILTQFLIGAARADTEIAPFPKVDKPNDGSCYIKQVPARYAYVTDSNHMVIDTEVLEESFVTAYKILPDGTDEFLWRSVGWYANQVFLTNDCVYLVRMGNWARGSEPGPGDLAVAFYKNGELLRSYSTADLIKDKNSVETSTGHYFWQFQGEGFPRIETWTGTFFIKTIEDIEFEFNFKTGELKRQ